MSDARYVHGDWAATEAPYVGDVTGGIEEAGEDATEPVDTLALAYAATLASEKLGESLRNPWALYTPQDAAVVVSAVHALLQSTVKNLRAMPAAVEHMAGRGDIHLPGPTEAFIAPEDETLGDALHRLVTMAGELDQLQLDMLLPAMRTLHGAPSRFQRAATLHANMSAIAEALGDAAELDTPDDAHHYPDATDSSCGCLIRIRVNGELYYFDCSDMGWSLLRDSAAVVHSDGSRYWSGTSYGVLVS